MALQAKILNKIQNCILRLRQIPNNSWTIPRQLWRASLQPPGRDSQTTWKMYFEAQTDHRQCPSNSQTDLAGQPSSPYPDSEKYPTINLRPRRILGDALTAPKQGYWLNLLNQDQTHKTTHVLLYSRRLHSKELRFHLSEWNYMPATKMHRNSQHARTNHTLLSSTTGPSTRISAMPRRI